MNVWLHDLSAGMSALTAADRTGMLRLLEQGAFRADEIAERLGLHPRGTKLALDVLAAHGIVVATGETYQASDALRWALGNELATPGRSSSLWAETESLVRTGVSAAHVRDTSERGAAYAVAVDQLRERFATAANALAGHIAQRIRDSEACRVLDVGAGSGVWSLSILGRLATATAVAVDLPGVVDRFVANAAVRGLADRVSTVPGDFHEVAFDTASYDLAILANVLHLETPARARDLLLRAGTSVRRSGRVVIVDVMSDGSGEADRVSAGYALHLALRVPTGHVHSRRQLEGWLAEAGVNDVERVPLDVTLPGLSALIGARR